MASRSSSVIQQHETHRQLVGYARPPVSRWIPPDAIVVPASRPAANLDQAVALAQAVNCRLVVFCSRQAKATEVMERVAATGFRRAIVADLPAGYTHESLRFRSSGVVREASPGIAENPNGDLSIKRNLGLLLARMLGWKRIFFMDDDIRDVTPADLYATVAMLGRHRSAGMMVTDFPDNSVVCHAHRETGAPQDTFVSGSALAVNILDETGFFPEVYNEDWLFFYDNARARRLGWSGANAAQLPYDPFDQPERTKRQEFGDVLAEGLYALLDEGAGETEADHDYWKFFLDARWRFLENIIHRYWRTTPDQQVKIIGSVQTAIECLVQIQPRVCDLYVKAWRDDLRNWAETMKSVPRANSIHAALGQLGLKPADTGYRERHRLSTAAVRRRYMQASTTAIAQVATSDRLQGLRFARLARERQPTGLAARLLAPSAKTAEPDRPGAGLTS